MSTLKTTNIAHESNSGTANMILASDGKVTVATGKLYCPGTIIQVVSETKTDTWSESVGEGAISSAVVTDLTPTMTCTSTSSKVLITGYVTVANNVGGSWGVGIILCNGTTAIADATGDAAGSRVRLSGKTETGYRGDCIPVNYLYSPSSTSAITYGIKVWNGHTGTQTIGVNYVQDDDTDDNNHYRSASTLTLMEIAG